MICEEDLSSTDPVGRMWTTAVGRRPQGGDGGHGAPWSCWADATARRWLRRILSRRMKWTSINVTIRSKFDAEWLRGRSTRRTTLTDPTLFGKACCGRVREFEEQVRVFARRMKLNLVHKAQTGNVCASSRLEALPQIQFRYSVTCAQVLLNSTAFIVPCSNSVVVWLTWDVVSRLPTCPCALWFWIHDVHMWWASCAHSAAARTWREAKYIGGHLWLYLWAGKISSCAGFLLIVDIVMAGSKTELEKRPTTSKTVKNIEAQEKTTKNRPIIHSYATFHSFPVTVGRNAFPFHSFLWKLFHLVVAHSSATAEVDKKLSLVWDMTKFTVFYTPSTDWRIIDASQTGNRLACPVRSPLEYVSTTLRETNNAFLPDATLQLLPSSDYNICTVPWNIVLSYPAAVVTWTMDTCLCRSRQLQTRRTISSKTSFRVHPLLGHSAKVKRHKIKWLHCRKANHIEKIYYVHTMFKVVTSLRSDMLCYLRAPSHPVTKFFHQPNNSFVHFYDASFVSTAPILHFKRKSFPPLMIRDAASLNGACNLDAFQCKADPWTSELLHVIASGDPCALSSESPQHYFHSACSNYRIASWCAFLEVADRGSCQNQGLVENRQWRSMVFLLTVSCVSRFVVPALLVWCTAVALVTSILVKFVSLRYH